MEVINSLSIILEAPEYWTLKKLCSVTMYLLID